MMQKGIEHSHFLHDNLRAGAPAVKKGKGSSILDQTFAEATIEILGES